MTIALQDLGIDRLSIDERLDLIAQIWDSIDEASEGRPLPDWHARLLEERLAAADADPTRGIPLDVVMARLGKRP